MELGGEDFLFGAAVNILLDGNASASDKFAAGELAGSLNELYGIEASIGGSASGSVIVLTGKTYLPDLPRVDAVEYDPFWKSEYADMLSRRRGQEAAMERARLICDEQKLGLENYLAQLKEYANWYKKTYSQFLN